MNKIYIVLSYNGTGPGRLIKLRSSVRFWNNPPGYQYTHVSLAVNDQLDHMLSFARKEINRPLHAGLIKEDIRKEMFAVKAAVSRIAVMEMEVSPEEYQKVCQRMNAYWKKRDSLHFHFLGLTTMLLVSRAIPVPNRFFCSQWVATVLRESGLDLFPDKKLHNIRPFDFYSVLDQNIIYEGMTTEYPKF